MQGRTGIPRVFHVGSEGDYNGIVTEVLGPNMESLRKRCNGHFTLGTTLRIAEQMGSFYY